MARAIVRYSLDRDEANQTGNQARAILENAGFTKIGTASYEADDLPQNELLNALQHLFGTLEAAPGGGTLDHLWIYVDPKESN